MSLPRSKFWVYVGVATALVGLLVSFQALGMVMPWQAATAAETASKDRVNALSDSVQDVDKRVSIMEQKFERIDGKLDILIDLHTK